MSLDRISLWMEQVADEVEPRAPLAGDVDVDIAIIGAGYTGLWTAYHLKRQQPDLNIAIFEAEHVGFGASGRNGGWLIGELAGQDELLAGLPVEEQRRYREMIHAIPDEAAEVFAREGIECGYRKGGMLICAARYPEQEAWLRAELTECYARGYEVSDLCWLEPDELAQQVNIAGSYGALYSPHCATVHPAKLALGLARVVEKLGVSIYESSRVEEWQPKQLRVSGHRVNARVVAPCVEGYAAQCAPLGKYQIAVQSLQIATEPLSPALWDQLGMGLGQAVGDASRMVTYFHRTRDDRLVFGARGGYRFGGRLREDFTLSRDEVAGHRSLMLSFFPQLETARITHGWGGNLGVSRRFLPHVYWDLHQGIALAGGYGGEGVGASFLCGRTLADLILGRDSDSARAPWVVRSDSLSQGLRHWEPEPFRWLGYSAVLAALGHENEVLANKLSPGWRRRMASALADRLERLMAPTRRPETP
ncbi:NAD(P)/FAD-dependent oxidoreductase [Marinobacterium sp. YM272]|uniref:NAD(P)/FAD-dependent oxidoreductase n=1 Tax=Marinobacterium sp. YM272 TaxID=3421654 RepID=UPI003D7FF27B